MKLERLPLLGGERRMVFGYGREREGEAGSQLIHGPGTKYLDPYYFFNGSAYSPKLQF